MVERLLLLACVLGVAGCATPGKAPEEIVVSLEKPIHFVGGDGADALVEPGVYRIEPSGADQLVLRGDEGEQTHALRAVAATHEEELTAPVAIALTGDEEDAFHLLYLEPGGGGLEAIGSYSGVHPRGRRRIITRPRVRKHALTRAGGTITVTAPGPNETVKAGKKLGIRWNKRGATGDRVTITLHYPNGRRIRTLASGAKNSGSFSCALPRSERPGRRNVAVAAYGGGPVGRSSAFTIAPPDPLPPTIDIFRIMKKNDEWYDYTLFHTGDRITCVIQLAWEERPTAPVRIRLTPSVTPENAVDFSCPEFVFVDPDSVSCQTEFVATVGAVRENATVANLATVVGGSSRKYCMASMEPGAGSGSPPYTGPYPAIASFSVQPSSAAFGDSTVTLTIRLDRAAPLDVPVQLMSSHPALIGTPTPDLVIPTGQRECVHSVLAGNPQRQTTVTLRALLPHAPTILLHEHELIVTPRE